METIIRSYRGGVFRSVDIKPRWSRVLLSSAVNYAHSLTEVQLLRFCEEPSSPSSTGERLRICIHFHDNCHPAVRPGRFAQCGGKNSVISQMFANISLDALLAWVAMIAGERTRSRWRPGCSTWTDLTKRNATSDGSPFEISRSMQRC